MLGVLLSLALQAQPGGLPPPPVTPEPAVYLPVRVESTVHALEAEAGKPMPEPLQLILVDEHTLRVQVVVGHDQLEQVNAPRISAWQSGDDLQIVVPLASRAASPFEPHCCATQSLVDLLVTLPANLPEQVTVRRERAQTEIIGEERLVPER